MKVIITRTAEASLEEIYRYKCNYSIAHADDFLNEIYAFIFTTLSERPHLGRPYNPEREFFRLIYSKGFNVYYTIRAEEVLLLFITDGAISLNQDLADPEIRLPIA
jgi:plasmid stabilization system protein ParE